MWKEFKPAFRFLFIFLGLYLVGNILYGLTVKSYAPLADPMTRSVAVQTSMLLNVAGYTTNTSVNPIGPTVFLNKGTNRVLTIFEGCNGLNVEIVFVAFILAFSGSRKKMFWFIPTGLLIIHMANLARIALLFFVAENFSNYFYYVHKYFFTAAIYVIVCLLWWWWILLNRKANE